MKSHLLFWVMFLVIVLPYYGKAANPATTSLTGLYGDTIDVVHYAIHLTNINVTQKSLQGYTDVTFTPLMNGISALPLELISLSADSVIINDVSVTVYSHQGTLLRIPLPQVMNVNDTATVRIYYHGTPFTDPSNWGGVHFSGEYVFNLGVGFDANPHNLGKTWFPCIDDFRDRAQYDVYVTVSNDKKAVCGGQLEDVVNNGDNTSTWHWETTYTLPTYLISFATGKYELITDTFNGESGPVPITWYARPADTSKITGSFVHLKEILENFEAHFGPYPFERVGYTATAQGAMEHAANISYPYSGWNGNTDNEWWYGHELSHMWFGDQVTCASAEDMWLNEGWARWCESLLLGGLYGEEAYKTDMRTKLKDVLQSTHVTDGGYYALYGIPSNLTYGSTVYDKGGQVVHTLRNYLGDSVFFNGVKAYLSQYAYNYASSENMRDFLSAYTGTDLTDFFNAWVFTPGFPHFSVDSFQVQQTQDHYDVTVFVRQKLKGTNTLANSNHLEITFMDSLWQIYSDTLHFSGLAGSKIFSVPFKPVVAMADYHEEISDAVTEYATTIKTTGEIAFPLTYAKVITQSVTDSAFVKINHNWVAPDSLQTPLPGLRMSDYRYWKVEGIFPPGFSAKARFSYNRGYNLDNTLLVNSEDSIVILYRKGPGHEWYGVPFKKTGAWSSGNLEVQSLQPGEYTLAVWDAQYVGIRENKPGTQLSVFPNPAYDYCNILASGTAASKVSISNSTGLIVKEFALKQGENHIRWDSINQPAGMYLINLIDKEKQKSKSHKLLIVK